MRKLLLSAAAAIVATPACHAVTTLQFGSASLGFLTGLANSSGQTNQTLVWGIVVDTAGNGVKPGEYFATGLSYADTFSIPQGQSLSIEQGVPTDDVLFISSNLMITSNTGDNSTGLAKPTNLTVSYAGDFGEGNPAVSGAGGQDFWIIWFDKTTKTGQAVTSGDHYGMYRITAFDLPVNTLGGSWSFASNFAGPDPANSANFTFIVPEPSAALLGLLGAAGLLRRRRD